MFQAVEWNDLNRREQLSEGSVARYFLDKVAEVNPHYEVMLLGDKGNCNTLSGLAEADINTPCGQHCKQVVDSAAVLCQGWKDAGPVVHWGDVGLRVWQYTLDSVSVFWFG